MSGQVGMGGVGMIVYGLMMVSLTSSLFVVAGIALHKHDKHYPPLWLQVACLVLLLCPTLILAAHIAQS